MADQLSKTAVCQAILAELSTELEAVERVAAMARDEVSSAETKQEGKYDTRATEASYLARGQAWRVAELRRMVAWFRVFDASVGRTEIGVGSLVCLDGPRRTWVFVAPVGGPKVHVDGETVRLVSPRSPLGRAMADLEADDVFEVDGPKGRVGWEVVFAV